MRRRDRASDAELQKLAQRLVKPDGEVWEEGELVDIRLAEDLKRRRQRRSRYAIIPSRFCAEVVTRKSFEI
jgi:hypothetical protein